MSAASCAEPAEPVPALIAASLGDGASELDPAQLPSLELVFDRPLVRDRGHARLRAPLLDVELPLVWGDDDTRAVVFFEGHVRSDRAYRLTLEGLTDDEGRAPLVDSLWPQGALHFRTVRRDFTAPTVTASSPHHLAPDVYPAPVLDGGAPKVKLSVTFDESMQPEARQVSWGPAGGARTPATATWSADARTLTFEIAAPAFSGRRPLEDRTRYLVDLSELRDLAGNAATLDGQSSTLEFTTGTYDFLLNHSCGHVLFGPFASASAAATRDLVAPRTDLAHTRYTIALPEGGAAPGFTRLRASADATWHLFLDGDLAVSVLDSEGNAVPATKRPVPTACAGITHRLMFSLRELEQAYLGFAPGPTSAAKLIVEIIATQTARPETP